MRRFFPGCKVKAKYPDASAWLAEKVLEFGFADEVVGCCRINHQHLGSDDTAVAICNNCMAMIGEDASQAALENIQVVEFSDAREKSVFCGESALKPVNLIELVSGCFINH